MRDALHTALGTRYRIERELGAGGMATVWMATDLRDARPVAIKVLRAELASVVGVDRFIREIRVTERLHHPNIIPVLDSGTLQTPDGMTLPWYAMSFVEGESLRQRLSREQYLPVDDALRITEDVADALRAAHREGVVHRDIKPENLLLAGEQVYVTDFGVAKAVIDIAGERLTSTGIAVGTPTYMSPEQGTAEAVDARSDQYSLACVLYEMLAGEPPFTGPTAQAALARRLAEPARPIRSVRPTVPASIEAVVLRALERVPADRYPDIAAFLEALRRARAAPATLPPRRQARHVSVVAGVAFITLLALAAWPLGFWRNGAQRLRDPDVLALHQRGLQGYDRRTPAGAADAIEAFSAAIRRDSTYAAAWTGLAKACLRAYERGFSLPGITRDSALRLAVLAADRASMYDPQSADAWLTRAMVARQVDPTDVAPAVRLVRRALAIDSASTIAWHTLALSLAELGDMDQALDAWRRSIASDPTYTQGLAFLGLGYYWRGQYDSAAFWLDSAIAVDPTYVLGRSSLGEIETERGDFARARAAFDAVGRLTTDVERVNALALLALVEERAGKRREAHQLLQRAESLVVAYDPTPLHAAVSLARAHAGLGDHRSALAWLHRYTTTTDLHFQLHLRCDPPFASLHANPEFAAILVKPRPRDGC